MRVEVQKASNFLTNLVRIQCGSEAPRLEQFCRTLELKLCDHYSQHWFPEKPCKGSGYRCIRINHKMDPIVAKAATESGFEEDSLPSLFPSELTLWIDPSEVSYRIGENGSICVLYEGSSTNRAEPNDNSEWNTSSSSSDDDSSSDDLSCSPMSMSPPSPKFNRMSGSCKRESGFIMDPRNLSYEFPTFVAS